MSLPNFGRLGVPTGAPKRARAEGGSSSTGLPGKWWIVDNGAFRVNVEWHYPPEEVMEGVIKFRANPLEHEKKNPGLAWYLYGASVPYNPLPSEGGDRVPADVMAGYSLWADVSLKSEHMLGEGGKAIAVYTAVPNMSGYVLKHFPFFNGGNPGVRDQVLAEMRKDYIDPAFGLPRNGPYRPNETSIPIPRVGVSAMPDEIHLIINLTEPSPNGCSRCITGVGIMPVEMDASEDVLNEKLDALIAQAADERFLSQRAAGFFSR